jgi:sec-independent protein translocase protein TatC
MMTAVQKVQESSSQRSEDDPLPLLKHLGDLRRCIIVCAVAVSAASFAVYPWIDNVLRDLARPVGSLIFVGPAEAFWSRIKLTFFLGFFASMPVVLFELWNFIQRGLLPREKRFVLATTVISYCLFLAGAAFCYLWILPVGVKFLLAYGSDVLVPMISISRYLSFAFNLVFSFGLAFELPLVVGFLAKMGILKAETLVKQRRFAIIVIFIAAAALTPGPDVFSQLLMAGPLLVLYEAGIIVARVIERRK